MNDNAIREKYRKLGIPYTASRAVIHNKSTIIRPEVSYIIVYIYIYIRVGHISHCHVYLFTNKSINFPL